MPAWLSTCLLFRGCLWFVGVGVSRPPLSLCAFACLRVMFRLAFVVSLSPASIVVIYIYIYNSIVAIIVV